MRQFNNNLIVPREVHRCQEAGRLPSHSSSWQKGLIISGVEFEISNDDWILNKPQFDDAVDLVATDCKFESGFAGVLCHL
jgi:hypothetical protein